MTHTQQEQLVFLPLGGCGEIGMNLNAYGYGPEEDRRWILIWLSAGAVLVCVGIAVLAPSGQLAFLAIFLIQSELRSTADCRYKSDEQENSFHQ